MIKFLLDPLTIVWILGLSAAFLLMTQKRKVAKLLFIIAATLFALITTPFLPNLLISTWESRLPRHLDLSQIPQNQKIHIMVLGSGDVQENGLSPNNQLTGSALQRLVEGVRIYHANPGSTLIFSGLSGTGKVSHAEIMKRTAMQLQVPEEDIVIFPTPHNTRTEAIAYKNMFGHIDPRPVLVTSASHMPRAMYLFEICGIQPYPAPADFLVKLGPRSVFDRLPSYQNLEKIRTYIIEVVGYWHSKWFFSCE
jgi:uncharacterized SAM-binding protein YcdF (DUF218 family)